MTDAKEEIDDTKMPLLDHLVELRGRMLKAFIAFIICFIACYSVAEYIFAFLTHPLAEAFHGESRRLIYTALHEAFFTYLKVAFFAQNHIVRSLNCELFHQIIVCNSVALATQDLFS